METLKQKLTSLAYYFAIAGFGISGVFAAFYAGSLKANDARPAMVLQAESVVRANQNWILASIQDPAELAMTRKELSDYLATELAVREVQNAFQMGVLSQYGYNFDWQLNVAYPSGEGKVQR